MNAVIKGTGYVMVHATDMVLNNGATQTTERIVNPESEYLKKLPEHLRSYEDAVSYYPNQAYIGNYDPAGLKDLAWPWYEQKMEGAERYGAFGEIMPEDEFLLLMQISDEFELVKLAKDFVADVKDRLAEDPIVTDFMMSRLHEGVEMEDIEKLINEEDAEPLKIDNKVVGCVKRAHNIDVNLSSHVMLENLVSKASSVLALAHAVRQAGIDKADVEYVIDCCEEACGDVNQRGGGNFAKATAEIVGLENANGSDTRGFCAAPAHALIEAASYIKAGVFKTVAVTAGGSTAKLGMNGKDHVKKEMPVLEDMVSGFCVILTADDGESPIINLEHIGRHRIGTGSAPQAVITALVTDPLDHHGLKVTDVDIFSPEMQNSDITKPAGAGDVTEANLKMIAALAVKRGELDRKEIKDFITDHGVKGFAPTQGHIPSGVPYMGFAKKHILDGTMKRVMIIGKGSLFLGRLTNQFDGMSFLIEENTGDAGEESAVSKQEIRKLIAESMRDFATNLLSQEEA